MAPGIPFQQWASIEASTILNAFARGDGSDNLVCLHEAVVALLCEAYARGQDVRQIPTPVREISIAAVGNN